MIEKFIPNIPDKVSGSNIHNKISGMIRSVAPIYAIKSVA